MSTIRRLYKRLLVFYPKAFREQLAESMAQTFNDLVNEKRQSSEGLFSFVIWTFAETTGGIIQEHISLLKQGGLMQPFLTSLKLPSLISFLLVMPFMIMEVVNRRDFSGSFPIPLFIIIWLLPVLVMLTGAPIVRNVRAGNNILAHPFMLLMRIVFFVFLIWMWFGILIDQMPCFLGVPNCD